MRSRDVLQIMTTYAGAPIRDTLFEKKSQCPSHDRGFYSVPIPSRLPGDLTEGLAW
jgi:hypothetical protein